MPELTLNGQKSISVTTSPNRPRISPFPRDPSGPPGGIPRVAYYTRDDLHSCKHWRSARGKVRWIKYVRLEPVFVKTSHQFSDNRRRQISKLNQWKLRMKTACDYNWSVGTCVYNISSHCQNKGYSLNSCFFISKAYITCVPYPGCYQEEPRSSSASQFCSIHHPKKHRYFAEP